MAIGNQIIDFVDDLDRSLFKLIAPQAPERIKTAEILDPAAREALAEDAFALVVLTKEGHAFKKFPIQDSAHTWLSNQYFEKTSAALPFYAQKIAASQLARACAVYGVAPGSQVQKLASNDVYSNRYIEVADWKKNREEPMQTKIAAAVKPDNSSHFYALGENYAMPTPEYTKKAAAYFVDHEREFQDAEDRHTFAANVLARAQEFGVQIDCAPLLQKYASQSYGDMVSAQMRARADVLQHKPEMCQALDKLASHQGTTEAATFARALYLFDKRAGVEKYYGKSGLMDAFASTFAKRPSMDKEADGYHWENSDGSLKMTNRDLKKLAEEKFDKVKSYFGNTLASALKKEAMPIFDSLPADAKETLARICKGEL